MATLTTFRKQPSEIQDYDIDFRAWLTALADSGASHTATITAGATIVSSSLTSGVVKVWVSGGSSHVSYKVVVNLTTAGGRVKQHEIVVEVLDT